MRSEKEGTTMDFTLSVNQCRLVRQHMQKIVNLFRVFVKLPDGNMGASSSPVWVEISGEKGNTSKAKDYMLSLCSTNMVEELLPEELLENLDLENIERESQAVLKRVGPGKLQINSHSQLIIATATSIIEHKYQLYKQRRELLTAEPVHLPDHRQNKNTTVVNSRLRSKDWPPQAKCTDALNDYDLPSVITYKQETNSLNHDSIDVIVPPRHESLLKDIMLDGHLVVPPKDITPSDVDVIVPPRDPNSYSGIDVVIPPKNCVSSNAISQDSWVGTKQQRAQLDFKDNLEVQDIDDEKYIIVPDDRLRNNESKDEPASVKIADIDITKPKQEVVVLTGGINEEKNTDEAKYEIMQKLGYTRDQVEMIICQLGPDADANDILGALVRQSSSSKADLDTSGVYIQEPREVRDVSDSTVHKDDADNLRTIIIDGSNVAMSFGNKDVFACKGIEIVVNWFLERGHTAIYVFVPNWRKEAAKPDTPITDQHVLEKLEKLKILIYTPSRRIGGRRVVCYDDRYIIKTAANYDGIVVSNDNFRDLQNETSAFKKVVEERLLMYSFVADQFMPPDDPLGRHGPSLDNFLRKRPTAPDHPPQACPYGKKCTYGNKCKYYHPERPTNQKSISEKLKERDESRKKSQIQNLLDGHKKDDNDIVASRHYGFNTAPLPRPQGLEYQKKDKAQTGPLPGYRNPGMASVRPRVLSESDSNHSYEAMPLYKQMPSHYVSGYRDMYAPSSNIHSIRDGMDYYTAPIPTLQHNRYQATAPLRHVPLGAVSDTVSRHIAFNPNTGANNNGRQVEMSNDVRNMSHTNTGAHEGGGMYSDLNAALAEVSLGNSCQEPSSPVPSQGRHTHYTDDMTRGYGSTHNNVPVSQPGHIRRHTQNFSNPSHKGTPLSLPSHHSYAYPQNLSGSHPGLYHQSGYSKSNTIQSLSTTSPFHMYPHLPLNEEKAISYSATHSSSPKFVDTKQPSLGSSSDQSLNMRRLYFLKQFKGIYGEDLIRKVFDMYPDEISEQHLHQRIRQETMFPSEI